LCSELGFELDGDQVAEAMKDLDLNGDGVIDIKEFARWWFSGMKSYSNVKRNMYKAMGGIKAFNAAAADPEMIQFVKDHPETISQKLSFAFNEPDSPETKILLRTWFTGPNYQKWLGKAKEWRNEKFGD
jgi:hypothetical protein